MPQRRIRTRQRLLRRDSLISAAATFFEDAAVSFPLPRHLLKTRQRVLCRGIFPLDAATCFEIAANGLTTRHWQRSCREVETRCGK